MSVVDVRGRPPARAADAQARRGRPDHPARARRRVPRDRQGDGRRALPDELLVDHPRVRGPRRRASSTPRAASSASRTRRRCTSARCPGTSAASSTASTDEIEEGDVIVHNHPYLGASHSPDVAVAVPIFHDGELLGFAAVTAHVLDVGGSFPGINADAFDVYAEAKIYNALRWYQARRAERGPRPDDLRQRPHRDDEPRRHERDARRLPARPRALPAARRALRRRRRDERRLRLDGLLGEDAPRAEIAKIPDGDVRRRSSAGSTTTPATATCGCASRRR